MAGWGITPTPQPERDDGLMARTIIGRTVGPCEHPFFSDWPYTTKVACGQSVDYGYPLPGACFPSLETKLSKLRDGDALLMVAATTPWFGEVVVGSRAGGSTVLGAAQVAPGYALDADEMHQIPRHWLHAYSRVTSALDDEQIHFVTLERIYAYDCPDWCPSLLDRIAISTVHWLVTGYILAKSLDRRTNRWTLVVGEVPLAYRQRMGRAALTATAVAGSLSTAVAIRRRAICVD